MRVITGTARGKRLKELPGLDTRPTTARVKEGLFSAIQFELEGRQVLDLFAGTGQLGIEALSRGAQHCDFVEQSAAAMKVVRENVSACALAGRAGFYRTDFMQFLSPGRGPYGVVFLDPPYGSGDLERALERLGELDLVVQNGIVTCEHPADRPAPAAPALFERGKSYRYGKIALTLFRRRPQP